MCKKIQQIIDIFRSEDSDTSTTETKVLLEIDKLLEKGPIDHIKNKDDFIKFIFSTYFYKSKYRPFVSILEIFFRYLLLFLVISLIVISIMGGLTIDENEVYFYKNIWILISNIVYFIFLFYICIRVYVYIRKLLGNEIRKNTRRTFGVGIIKVILFLLLVTLTWFIGQFIASIIMVGLFSADSLVQDLK